MYKMTEKNFLLQTLLLPLVLLSGQVYRETRDLALTPGAPSSRLLGEAIPGNSTVITWDLTGPPGRRLHLNCTDLTLLKSDDCSEGSLSIFENGKEKKICKRESTVYSWESEGNRLTVRIQSEPSSSGGRVSCDISLLKGSAVTDSGDYMDSNVPNDSKASSPSGGTDRKRIIGGEETMEDAYPFMAAILIRQQHQFVLHCGGTIVTHRHVLTAAQCLHGQPTEELRVVTGIHNFNEPKKTQSLTIIRTYLHPGYPSKERHDIAVILVDANIVFGYWAGPVHLPVSQYRLREIRALGWGKTKSDRSAVFSLVRQSMSVPVLELKDCIPSNGCLVSTQNTTQICIGSSFSKDTGQGDKGGPLVIRDLDYGTVQVGLITDKRDCEDSMNHLNTAVFPYVRWIWEVVSGWRYYYPGQEITVTLENPGESRNLIYPVHQPDPPSKITITWVMTGPNGTQFDFSCSQPNKNLSLSCDLTITDDKNVMRGDCKTSLYRKRSVSNGMTVHLEIDGYVEGINCSARLLSTDPQNVHSDLKPTSCPCGRRNEGRPVGGEEEFTFVAYLSNCTAGTFFRKPRCSGAVCGGTILTERHILTAASCINRHKLDDWQVVVGGHFTKTGYKKKKSLSIQEIYVHENYKAERYFPNDIALLKLSKDMKFNDVVGPVCLPSEPYDLAGMRIKALGWSKDPTPALLQEPVTVGFKLRDALNPQNIDHVNLTNPTQFNTQTKKVGMKSTSFFNTSQNAAGTPLVYLDPDLLRYVQVGFFSYISEINRTSNFVQYSIINTDVFKYLNWIEEQIDRNNVKTGEEYRTCRAKLPPH